MEDIIKTITTKKGARVSLVQPQGKRPFFRYEAGANAITDTFRYLIRQHGQEDTATVTVNVELPLEQDTPQDYFNRQVKGFMKCLEKFMDGSTATLALFNMLGIDEGETLNSDWMEEIFKSFNFFDYATEKGQPFVFEDHTAQYIYKKEGYWEMMPGKDSIEIIFPSSRESLDNDAVLAISDYKYTEVKTEDELNFYPTHVSVQLRIKEQPYFSFTLNGKKSETETEYHQGSGYPIAFDARLHIEPYNLELLLKNDSGKVFYPSISLRDSDGCKLGMDAEVHLHDDLNSNLQSEQVHVENVSLYVNELTFRGLETFWLANQTNPETQEDIDNTIKITCEYKGDTIGQVRFLLEEEAAVLEYQDGTSQNLNELVMNFLNEYFNNEKPNGTPRNKAFDMNDENYRGAGKKAKSMKDSSAKMSAKVAEGMRRRTSKSDVSGKKVADIMSRFFSGKKEEEYDHYPYGGDSYYYEEEMKRQEEEERKRKEEEERRFKEEEDRRLKQEEERKFKEEEDRRLKQEEERKFKEEEDRRLKQEEERKFKEEEDRRLKKEEEEKRRREEEKALEEKKFKENKSGKKPGATAADNDKPTGGKPTAGEANMEHEMKTDAEEKAPEKFDQKPAAGAQEEKPATGGKNKAGAAAKPGQSAKADDQLKSGTGTSKGKASSPGQLGKAKPGSEKNKGS